MDAWVWAVNQENWPTVKGKKIWAVDSLKKSEKIKSGDRIIFYVTGTNYFQGIFEVVGEWHTPSVEWPDGREIVAEIDLKELVVGFVNIEHVANLEFIKLYKNIGLALKASSYGPSNSSMPISQNDYAIIYQKLKDFPNEPESDEEIPPSVDLRDFRDDSFISTSGSVRYHVVKSLYRDLLGPRMGPGEIIENPYEQYTVGILRSIYKSKDTKSDPVPSTDPAEKLSGIDETFRTDYDSSDDDVEYYQADADLNPMQGARSLGLSFVVRGLNPKIRLCCTWGRYENLPGLPSEVWKRFTNYYISDYLNVSTLGNSVITPNAENGKKEITMEGIAIHVRTIPIKEENDEWNVSIFLVNKTPFIEKQKPEHFVFQPQIRVKCDSETTIEKLGKTFLKGEKPNNDDLIFLDRSSRGRGHLCGAVWKEIDPAQSRMGELSFSDFSWPDANSEKFPSEEREPFSQCDIRTEFLPMYAVLQPDLTDSSYSYDAENLANLWDDSDIEKKFGAIVNRYHDWIVEKYDELDKTKNLSDILISTAKENLKECERCADRIKIGYEFLIKDQKAKLAFCFMNKVMADKRRWDNRDKKETEKKLLWHEFQIAFILQSLMGVVPGNDAEKDVCEVLWFPTGGGKTEAYLGLMIFTIAYRRLIDLSEFEIDGGVSVISRYTLRLLTIQQFNRALSGILAAERLRVMRWIPNAAKLTDQVLSKKFSENTLWGKNRFSLGIWIGDLTPNKFEIQDTKFTAILNAEGALLPQYKRRKTSDYNGEPAQILECPCCGETLAIPSEKETKPEERVKTLTWIIKTDKSLSDLSSIPARSFSGDQIVLEEKNGQPAKEFYEIGDVDATGKKYYGLRVNFRSVSQRPLTDTRVDNWWINFVQTALGFTKDEDILESTRASRPGYFFLYREGENKPYDFTIHCPNRNCEINQLEWHEETTKISVPSLGKPFRDRKNPTRSRYTPIPAFTVDEQVYSRCPSVVIATADKFARLAYEPLSSSLFGNVEFHDRFSGYGRGAQSEDSKNRVQVKPFLPPSLIIQDELHLIEGPLGSMVGLYEIAMDVLSSNEKFIPKYIASTATIKEAESQIGTIYRKSARIFPPLGIDFSDNYFSKTKEDPSCLIKKPGRLYLGILSPKGSLIVPVKIWASLLSSIYRIRQNPGIFGMDKQHAASGSEISLEEYVMKETDWYWTLVGYFNALRELSIAKNLYSADILRDVKKWSSINFQSILYRYPNVKLKPALRFVPIQIESDAKIKSVIVNCTNNEGHISISVYNGNSTTVGSLIMKSKKEYEKKECRYDENEFVLENSLSVKKGELYWVAIYNYSEKTRFQSGASTIQGKIMKNVPIENDTVVFPDVPDKWDETKSTVRIQLRTEPRELHATSTVELSSSTDSLELPEIMERLQSVPNSTDCLFTTSMFGTGIDIDRLGLMTVMGQPKSTSSYIQATGRVGRKCPGLVVTWLRAGRVRDLNHYENFIGYHRSIHRFVEPVTAAPFSEEAMDLCLGPVAVSILRNARKIRGQIVKKEWRDKDDGPLFMANHFDDPEINALKTAMHEICSSNKIFKFRKMSNEDITELVSNTLVKWSNSAAFLKREGQSAKYEEYTMTKKPEHNVVLGTPQHKIAGKSVVYRNARTSLRDVESTCTVGDSGWSGSS